MPRAARRPEAPTAHKSRIFRYTFLLVTDVLLKVAFQKGFKEVHKVMCLPVQTASCFSWKPQILFLVALLFRCSEMPDFPVAASSVLQAATLQLFQPSVPSSSTSFLRHFGAENPLSRVKTTRQPPRWDMTGTRERSNAGLRYVAYKPITS